jgi:putative transposase
VLGVPSQARIMLLKVSPSGYYSWRDRPLSAMAAQRAEIAVLAADAHAASNGANGYGRVYRDLPADGLVCSWQLVRRVMREGDIAGAQPAAYRVTTRQDSDAKAAPAPFGASRMEPSGRNHAQDGIVATSTSGLAPRSSSRS